MAVKYGSLPFAAQIAFFKQKVNLPARGWTDLWQSEHDHAFVVAGALRKDLVQDLRGAVQKAIEAGTTIQQFRKDFDAIVEKNMWSYHGSRNWRTRIIYETNIRTSYAAGRYKQMQQFEFWQYHHSPASENARPEHEAWDGLILPKNDPFWQMHYPPNGFGCKCTATGYSKQRMRAKGLNPSASPEIQMEDKLVGVHSLSPRTVSVPKGVAPGFAYAPGESWYRQMTPSRAADALAKVSPGGAATALPVARSSQPKPLPENWSDKQYVQWFLDEMGANGKPYAMHRDAAKQMLILSDEMFKNHRGELKLRKHDRHLLLPALAQTIKDPDQIRYAWQPVKSGSDVLRSRYIKVFDSQPYGMAVFELEGKQWREITLFHITDAIVKKSGVKSAEDYIRLFLDGSVAYEKKAAKK